MGLFCLHCSPLPLHQLGGEVWAGLSSNHPAHRPDVGGLEPTQTYPLLVADPSVWVLSHVPPIAPCFSLLHEGPFLLQHFPRNTARKWLLNPGVTSSPEPAEEERGHLRTEPGCGG